MDEALIGKLLRRKARDTDMELIEQYEILLMHAYIFSYKHMSLKLQRKTLSIDRQKAFCEAIKDPQLCDAIEKEYRSLGW